MVSHIYGVLDKTGSCPFYTNFFKKEEDALKELKKQMVYAKMDLGMNLFIKENKVYDNKNIVFSIDKFLLK